MKIEKALGKNGDGNNTAKQNEPHQRPPLLHVVDHSRLIDELSPACKDQGKCQWPVSVPVGSKLPWDSVSLWAGVHREEPNSERSVFRTDTGAGTGNSFLRVMFPSLPALPRCLFCRAGKERGIFLFKLVQKPLGH